MADDSELDYIRTFVGEAMTGYTIKHYSEVRNLHFINDTQRGLVYPGELLTVNEVYYEKRYKLKLEDTTEAALNTGMKNLISGIRKYNRRIAGVTQVASMSVIHISSGNQAYEVGSNKKWNMDIMLDITWSVA
jgi:hypothetical protein